MKKIAIFFLAVFIIVGSISYLYMNFKANYNEAKKENKQFVSYDNKEISGTELTTIINKAMDNNKNNQVQKDKKGKYIDNENNSINIDIEIIDNNTTYPMEILYNGGMDKFVEYYGTIQFKCEEIQYHKLTGKVKKMLFTQITQ